MSPPRTALQSRADATTVRVGCRRGWRRRWLDWQIRDRRAEIRRLEALQVRDVAAFIGERDSLNADLGVTGAPGAYRCMVAEVALSLDVSVLSAQSLLSDAHSLVERHPAVLRCGGVRRAGAVSRAGDRTGDELNRQPRSAAAGRGLSKACHTSRDHPAMHVVADPASRKTTWRTPTGLTYNFLPPPTLGSGSLTSAQMRLRHWQSHPPESILEQRAVHILIDHHRRRSRRCAAPSGAHGRRDAAERQRHPVPAISQTR
jgi:hypothetical protein